MERWYFISMTTTIDFQPMLDEINQRYIREHGPITPDAVQLIERLTKEIEDRTEIGKPAPGDVVVCIGPKKRYESGHLEAGHYPFVTDPAILSGCTIPDRPHISSDGRIQASGGYWFAAPILHLVHVGRRRKLFWTWGRLPCASGGVYFYAMVNVWQFTDEKIY